MHGFAAIELAIVLAILGILVAVAAPSYVGSAHRDASPTASNQIKVAVIEAEAYRLDNATYRGMTPTQLIVYRGVKVDHVVVSPDGRTYCLDKTVHHNHAYVIRGFAPHTPTASRSMVGSIDQTGVCPPTLSDTRN